MVIRSVVALMQVLLSVLPHGAGTNFTPWWGEAVAYGNTAQRFHPPGDRTRIGLYSSPARLTATLRGPQIIAFCGQEQLMVNSFCDQMNTILDNGDKYKNHLTLTISIHLPLLPSQEI